MGSPELGVPGFRIMYVHIEKTQETSGERKWELLEVTEKLEAWGSLNL